jgi:mRNA deadenylase 3'-5' endonuclease subunit Ccr4
MDETVSIPPLRVMQWNILADGLAQFGDFIRAPKEILEWSTRAPKLLNKILEASADIVCLQELNHYDDYFLPELRQHGYLGLFKPKKHSPAMKYGCPPDGSAVFFRAARLQLSGEDERFSMDKYYLSCQVPLYRRTAGSKRVSGFSHCPNF